MQASKIIPKRTYAVNDSEHGLVRFRVTRVDTITRRKAENRSPHDSHSEVRGHFQEPGVPLPEGEQVLDPDHILGPFEDYTELVAKRKAEAEANEAARKAEEERIAELVCKLYAFCGRPIPNKLDAYDNLFRSSYSRVEITSEGVQVLLDAINGRLTQ